MSETAELAALAEALLAAAGEPVPFEALHAAAGEGVERGALETALAFLQARHNQPGSGLVVEQVAGGWRLATRPEHESALRVFLGLRAKARLSQAALETLAIVAYRQPITLPEINFLRSVSSAGVVRTLLERTLVRVAGRKEVVGTPLLYRTTKQFLVSFGLESLAALPTIEEVAREVGEPADGT
ncbi:MAG: SMC-Scp complex subunit ScpB [Acidobacteriota bacterium]